jgi:hypothetical protein
MTAAVLTWLIKTATQDRRRLGKSSVFPHLVVDDCHVKIAKLLQGIGEVGMSLSHLCVQQNATVIECYALLIIAQLIIDRSNQQQQVCSVSILRVDLRARFVISLSALLEIERLASMSEAACLLAAF